MTKCEILYPMKMKSKPNMLKNNNFTYDDFIFKP